MVDLQIDLTEAREQAIQRLGELKNENVNKVLKRSLKRATNSYQASTIRETKKKYLLKRESIEKNMHIAEIFVNVKGMFLKGIERSEDMYASIDMAVDKIERQVVKYKEKLISRKNIENRESMEDLKLSVYDYNEDSAIDEPTVVISKQIPAKPMDIEEAIMQMDLMNKNFFVFRNAENSEINVVYKRDDGKVGIIEP